MKWRGSLSTELDQGHKKLSKLSMRLLWLYMKFHFKTKILHSLVHAPAPSRLRSYETKCKQKQIQAQITSV